MLCSITPKTEVNKPTQYKREIIFLSILQSGRDATFSNLPQTHITNWSMKSCNIYIAWRVLFGLMGTPTESDRRQWKLPAEDRCLFHLSVFCKSNVKHFVNCVYFHKLFNDHHGSYASTKQTVSQELLLTKHDWLEKIQKMPWICPIFGRTHKYWIKCFELVHLHVPTATWQTRLCPTAATVFSASLSLAAHRIISLSSK